VQRVHAREGVRVPLEVPRSAQGVAGASEPTGAGRCGAANSHTIRRAPAVDAPTASHRSRRLVTQCDRRTSSRSSTKFAANRFPNHGRSKSNTSTTPCGSSNDCGAAPHTAGMVVEPAPTGCPRRSSASLRLAPWACGPPAPSMQRSPRISVDTLSRGIPRMCLLWVGTWSETQIRSAKTVFPSC
jgi:hypothetical protein